MSKPARKLNVSATPWGPRHAESPAPPVVAPASEPAPVAPPLPTTVARPLRLSAATDAKLRQLALACGGISLTAAVSHAICAEWDRVFKPSTENVVDQVQRLIADSASPRALPDTVTPSADAKRSSRTLRLNLDVDTKLGELAQHQGGLDRNSTITVVIVSAWRRACSSRS